MDRLTAMQVFVSVVDSGSQSAAALQLDMSRPVISRYLAELEEWVGARLLHRTTRRLSLTPAGNEILERCRQMLSSASDLQNAVSQPQQAPRGLLRITTTTSFGPQLARAVTAYCKRYPGVAVDLMMLDRTVNLVEERIDLAIRMTTRLDPSLIARKLSVCRSTICASPDYLREHGTPKKVADLALHNCLTHSYVGKSLWEFDHKGKQSSVAVSGNISANEAMVLLICPPMPLRRMSRPEDWWRYCRSTNRPNLIFTACTPRASTCRRLCAPCWIFWRRDLPANRNGVTVNTVVMA